METRQDTTETELRTLSAVVNRVELNQQHATELAQLHYQAMDTSIKTIDSTLERFMGRINAIVSGEVKLPQQSEYDRWLAGYQTWHDSVEERFDHVDLTLAGRVRVLEDRALRGAGVVEVFGSTKTVLLVLAAFLGPIIGLIALVSR